MRLITLSYVLQNLLYPFTSTGTSGSDSREIVFSNLAPLSDSLFPLLPSFNSPCLHEWTQTHCVYILSDFINFDAHLFVLEGFFFNLSKINSCLLWELKLPGMINHLCEIRSTDLHIWAVNTDIHYRCCHKTNVHRDK